MDSVKEYYCDLKNGAVYYIGANTRKQLKDVEEQVSKEKTERGFLLYYTANNKELQVAGDFNNIILRDHKSVNWTDMSWSDYAEKHVQGVITIVGHGHSHGKYSIEEQFGCDYACSVKKEYNPEKMNSPSAPPHLGYKGMTDYKSPVKENSKVSEYKLEDIHPTILITPFGYTIYSTLDIGITPLNKGGIVYNYEEGKRIYEGEVQWHR